MNNLTTIEIIFAIIVQEVIISITKIMSIGMEIIIYFFFII